jgi:hypothetical protein
MYEKSNIKEICELMSEAELLNQVETICSRCNIPSDGWTYYAGDVGPTKIFRRRINGKRTHTAMVKNSWLEIYVNPSDCSECTKILVEGLDYDIHAIRGRVTA